MAVPGWLVVALRWLPKAVTDASWTPPRYLVTAAAGPTATKTGLAGSAAVARIRSCPTKIPNQSHPPCRLTVSLARACPLVANVAVPDVR